MAGDGVLRSQLAEAARAAGVPLHLLGFRNQSAMPAAYAAADALVLPSDGRETWGLVANEALACGRPVIVSDACGCAPDLAVDGTAGRTFPCGNVARLAQAIDEVCAAQPASQAIADVSSRYSLHRAAAGIAAALAAVRSSSTI